MNAGRHDDHRTEAAVPTLGPGGMYVKETGTPGAPAIVFIHGLGQSGRIWHGHMAELSGFHCLAPDLPGFGRSNHLAPSSNARIVALLAELIGTRVPSRRAHVTGLSWGALLALALLDRHPGLIDRVIADGIPIRWPRGSKPLLLWVMTVALPLHRSRPVRALFGNVMDEADIRAASRLAFWRAFAGSMVRLPALSDVPNATLIVAGERERSYRPANAALASRMLHAEARFAPGLGHCWQLKAPDLHIRMVEAWVSRQELPADLQPEPAPSPEVMEPVRAIAAADGTDEREMIRGSKAGRRASVRRRRG